MNRNFLFLIVLFFLGSNFIFSQKERIEHLQTFDKRTLHFGYYLGINNIGYKVSYNSPFDYSPIPPEDKELFVSIDESIGFNIGFIVDYRLHKNINLRFEPGLMSTSANLNFLNANIGPENPFYNGTQITERKFSGTYLHLPLLFKFSTNRLDNIRPYIIGGASYDYNFSSKESNSDDNYQGEFRTNTSNFMYEVGIGMDFYFYFFKFSPSIRGVFAINDQLVRDINPDSPWTEPIDYFGTRGIYLNLTFE